VEGSENVNRPNGVKGAKVIQVIETKAMRGLGTEKDPARVVTQYWDFDGNFLAEMDLEACAPLVEHEIKAIKESMISGH
jgi:hypothetical protein